MPRTTVTIQRCGSPIASAVTDDNGYFTIRGLQPGVYEIQSAGGVGLFRLWAPGTAPPAATAEIQITGGSTAAAAPSVSPPSPPGQSMPVQSSSSPPPNNGPPPPPSITNGQVVTVSVVTITSIAGIITAVTTISINERPSGS